MEADGNEGREGSKKPCECCRRWLLPSVPIKGEFLREGNSRSLEVWGIEGREKLLSEAELAFELDCKYAIEGRWNGVCVG